MRHRVSITTTALAAAIAGAALLICSATSFAGTPSLGAGCGSSGASIVGSDTAGRVTLGTGTGTCILTFSGTYTSAPACTAMNETNGGAHAVPAGVKATTTQLTIDSPAPWSDGDTIAYICSTY